MSGNEIAGAQCWRGLRPFPCFLPALTAFPFMKRGCVLHVFYMVLQVFYIDGGCVCKKAAKERL